MDPPFLPRAPITTVSAIDLVLGKKAYNVGLFTITQYYSLSVAKAINGADLIGPMNSGAPIEPESLVLRLLT